jgi:4-hydroxybenzoyl-CoA thioesterase
MKIYRHAVSVHWGDTDPAKIVFYPNYFSWFDQSTRMLFESVGLDWDTLMARYGVPGLPIVEANARFMSPSVFRDELIIESHVGQWSDKTLQVRHTVFNRGVRAVEGFETRVWTRKREDDPTKMKAASIPEEIRRAFD